MDRFRTQQQVSLLIQDLRSLLANGCSPHDDCDPKNAQQADLPKAATTNMPRQQQTVSLTREAKPQVAIFVGSAEGDSKTGVSGSENPLMLTLKIHSNPQQESNAVPDTERICATIGKLPEGEKRQVLNAVASDMPKVDSRYIDEGSRLDHDSSLLCTTACKFNLQTQERERRLNETEVKFKMLLNESKEFLNKRMKGTGGEGNSESSSGRMANCNRTFVKEVDVHNTSAPFAALSQNLTLSPNDTQDFVPKPTEGMPNSHKATQGHCILGKRLRFCTPNRVLGQHDAHSKAGGTDLLRACRTRDLKEKENEGLATLEEAQEQRPVGTFRKSPAFTAKTASLNSSHSGSKSPADNPADSPVFVGTQEGPREQRLTRNKAEEEQVEETPSSAREGLQHVLTSDILANSGRINQNANANVNADFEFKHEHEPKPEFNEISEEAKQGERQPTDPDNECLDNDESNKEEINNQEALDGDSGCEEALNTVSLKDTLQRLQETQGALGPTEFNEAEDIEDDCPSSSTDLLSTLQTEELFKKYVGEKQAAPEAKTNALIEASYNSLLRYVEMEAAIQALENVVAKSSAGVSKMTFIDALHALVLASPLKPEGLSERERSQLEAIYDVLSKPGDARLKVEEIVGALCLFCKGTQVDKLRCAFVCLSGQDSVSLDNLRTYLQSQFKVLLRALPNSAKNAQIAPSELGQMAALQCFDDNHVLYDELLSLDAFLHWISAQTKNLAPTCSTIQAEELEPQSQCVFAPSQSQEQHEIELPEGQSESSPRNDLSEKTPPDTLETSANPPDSFAQANPYLYPQMPYPMPPLCYPPQFYSPGCFCPPPLYSMPTSSSRFPYESGLTSVPSTQARPTPRGPPMLPDMNAYMMWYYSTYGPFSPSPYYGSPGPASVPVPASIPGQASAHCPSFMPQPPSMQAASTQDDSEEIDLASQASSVTRQRELNARLAATRLAQAVSEKKQKPGLSRAQLQHHHEDVSLSKASVNTHDTSKSCIVPSSCPARRALKKAAKYNC